MPAEEERKILSDKGLITLPKPLRDYHKIKKGDRVKLVYDSVTVVIPKGVKLNEKKQEALRILLD